VRLNHQRQSFLSSNQISERLDEILTAEQWEKFLIAASQFNEQKYLDCHETFEDIWRTQTDTTKELIQGIIQLAVALHHLQHDNLVGASRLLARSLTRLQAYRAKQTGINVKKLCDTAEHLLHCLESDAKRSGSPLPRCKIEFNQCD
jgi:predicted metal-dependent hydrolase